MIKEDNKALKRILFLFVFVLLCASIVLLRPNTLSKLQGNASSYNKESAIYEETGVVISTNYLIEDLSSNNYKLHVYNGSNNDIKITKIISKKIGQDDYVEYNYNEFIKANNDTKITFNKDRLNCGETNSVCSEYNKIDLDEDNSISYQNFVIGIEYQLNDKTYYLSSTVLYLDTSKLLDNNIETIRNYDNSKNNKYFIHNITINENNKLETIPFTDEDNYYSLKQTNNKGEYELNLNEKIKDKITYDYILENDSLANITYNYEHDKYMFVDINESPNNVNFNFDVSYKFNNFNDLLETDIFYTYEKFLITTDGDLNEKLFEMPYFSYVPISDFIYGYNNYYYKPKATPYNIVDEIKDYKLQLDTTKFLSNKLFLKQRFINQFYKTQYNNSDKTNGIYSPVIVTSYDKTALKEAILNGISKLRNAYEDSIDVNSYLTYTDLLATAIDLYSSRYSYEIDGKTYLVNSANIYQLTNILNEYKFKEQKKADYKEINKTIEIAYDALNKYKDNPIIVNVDGVEKNVNSDLTNLINDFKENYSDLSINYQSFINNYKTRIEAEIKNFPVYTKDYMQLRNDNNTPKINPKVESILIDVKKIEENFINNVEYAIYKASLDNIDITSYELMKEYLFGNYTYEMFYIKGPMVELYAEEVWNEYYEEYNRIDISTLKDMNFLEHQEIINEATTKLELAITKLKDNPKIVDSIWYEDVYEDEDDYYKDLIEYLNSDIHSDFFFMSKETYNELKRLGNTLKKKLPLDGTSVYNGKEVSNQVFFNNTIIEIYTRFLHELIFNKDYDGIRKNGRNSREGLGYLTVEEYYDFFYDLDINDYDLETLEKAFKTSEAEIISESIPIGEEKIFKYTFEEWYANYIITLYDNNDFEFAWKQSSIYAIQESFMVLKNLLIPKVGDYTDICNYYKVLTSLNLDYYYPETKNEILDNLWKINWSYRKNEQSKIDEQARELKAFIDSLVMKKADTTNLYKAYNAALKYDKNLYSNYYELEDAISGFSGLNNAYIDKQKDVDALTIKIVNSIKGLTLKKANYTNIEYLKAKISDLDPERYENFHLVNNALNNIVYGLDITKQSEVDKMYDDLLKAYTELKRNGNDPADYEEYKKVVSNVPSFVKGYDKETQDKINNLKNEIESFSMDLKLKDQAKIDNMVVKIKKLLNELDFNYSGIYETVTPTDASLIKSIKIDSNAIDISRIPFDYSIGYSDTSVEIEVEAIKDAKVFVYGGSSLFYGENVVTIQIIHSNKIYNYELNIYRKTSSDYLKSLKIHTKGAIFNSENFNKEKQDYIVKINNDVTRLDIEAIPEEEEARINIKNNHNLKDDSRIQIEVTSKDGSFRVYTLIIKKTSVVNYKVLIILLVIFMLLGLALKGLQVITKKKTENE